MSDSDVPLIRKDQRSGVQPELFAPRQTRAHAARMRAVSGRREPKPKKDWWKGGILGLDAVGRAQVVQSIYAFLAKAGITTGVTVVTVVAGIFESCPIVLLAPLGALAFMGSTVGLYYLSAYGYTQTPANKLRYVGTMAPIDLDPGKKSKKALITHGTPIFRTISKAQLGVQLQNHAHFPISAYIESAASAVEDNTPPRTEYPKEPVTILPGNTVFMCDEPIAMESHLCGRLEGRMDIIVKYGKPGKEKFELSFNGRVEIFMTAEGLVQATYTHWDSNQI